jgi:hypothetical protein
MSMLVVNTSIAIKGTAARLLECLPEYKLPLPQHQGTAATTATAATAAGASNDAGVGWGGCCWWCCSCWTSSAQHPARCRWLAAAQPRQLYGALASGNAVAVGLCVGLGGGGQTNNVVADGSTQFALAVMAWLQLMIGAGAHGGGCLCL